MARLIGLALLPLAAYWSVWADYAARLARDPQSLAHPVALLAGVAVLWRPRAHASATARRVSFALATLAALAFALSYAQLSAMPRYALALLGTGTFVCWQRGSARPWLGLSVLLLALPMLGQLEHLVGLSLRLSVAEAAAALVRGSGLAVISEGTRLAWSGGFVDVDAPCSGLRMLWAGALVSLLAVAHFKLRAADALALLLAAPPLLWLANVMRCAALFYVESGILPAPGGMHAGVGLVVFASVCAALWETARWLVRRRSSCVAS